MPSRIGEEKLESHVTARNNAHDLGSSRLGKFADMVLNATDVAYRCKNFKSFLKLIYLCL